MNRLRVIAAKLATEALQGLRVEGASLDGVAGRVEIECDVCRTRQRIRMIFATEPAGSFQCLLAETTRLIGTAFGGQYVGLVVGAAQRVRMIRP